MGLGTVTLLGLLCAPGQAPADVTTWNSPSMKIPIDYHPSKRGEIRELLLYVSSDQGQSWQQQATGTPERDSFFNFNAPADGVYWFNMVVVDKAGRREPADVFKAAPALKVLFDTKKPVVQIASAQRVGDDVTVVWKVTEKNPDWSKFRLEYSANGTTWTPVQTRPELDGSTSFRVPAGTNVTVRVSLTDLAGHMGEATAPVAGTAAAVANSRSASDPIVPVQGTADPAPPPVIGGTGPAPIAPPPSPPATDRGRDNRLTTDPRGTDTPAGPAVGVFPPAPGTPGAPVIPPGDPLRSDPVGVSPTIPANLPPPQVINVTSFKLAYEVEDKGASGVGKAEVYVSRDEGRTWAKWQTIDKPDSPLLIELSKGNRDVEGIYGVKVLLQSGAGLSREAPKPGEAPDLRVDVDITPPVVQIYAPIPDSTQKDTMILRWHAHDRNLATDPMTIEWADGPKGPWTPVATADSLGSNSAKRLPNTGSYPWRLPANFPTHKVYLKVTARDTAGNVAEAVTNDPVLVDLNKPAAVKLNIVGSGR
ncbi:MAG TPA: hypothetical protein VKD90_05935 [Gemmataceae bacterium]|nr:hypothetical protein [Gemmataceae bacterium]